MTRFTLLGALILGGLMAISGFQVELLVRPVLAFYLIIAGVLVMLGGKSPWAFLRPLALFGLALLFVPPVFEKLVKSARVSLVDLTFGWMWPLLLAALTVFIIFHFWIWLRRRPPRRQAVFRERERVMPGFDPDDDGRD